MMVYHRTSHSAEILGGGFRDAEGTYMTDISHRGIWVSDRPLDISEGADGDVLLGLDILVGLFEKYEWVEDEKPYRESLIPANELNCYPIQVCKEE